MNFKVVTIIVSLTTLLTSGVITGVTNAQKSKNTVNQISMVDENTKANINKYEANEEKNTKKAEDSNLKIINSYNREESNTNNQNDKKDKVNTNNLNDKKDNANIINQNITKEDKANTINQNIIKEDKAASNANDKIEYEKESVKNEENVYIENTKNTEIKTADNNSVVPESNKVEKNFVDESVYTGNEGMLGEFGVPCRFTITQHQYLPVVGGYGFGYIYATFDLKNKTMTITYHREVIPGIWDSLTEEEKIQEGSRVKETSETYNLSTGEARILADLYHELGDNKSDHDLDALKKYENDMFEKQINGTWNSKGIFVEEYYYSLQIEGSEETIGYIFEDVADLYFLHDLINV